MAVGEDKGGNQVDGTIFVLFYGALVVYLLRKDT
jgi:hypothetical protein